MTAQPHEIARNRTTTGGRVVALLQVVGLSPRKLELLGRLTGWGLGTDPARVHSGHLADSLDRCGQHVRRELAQLVDANVLERVGPKRRGTPATYRLQPDPEQWYIRRRGRPPRVRPPKLPPLIGQEPEKSGATEPENRVQPAEKSGATEPENTMQLASEIGCNSSAPIHRTSLRQTDSGAGPGNPGATRSGTGSADGSRGSERSEPGSVCRSAGASVPERSGTPPPERPIRGKGLLRMPRLSPEQLRDPAALAQVRLAAVEAGAIPDGDEGRLELATLCTVALKGREPGKLLRHLLTLAPEQRVIDAADRKAGEAFLDQMRRRAAARRAERSPPPEPERAAVPAPRPRAPEPEPEPIELEPGDRVLSASEVAERLADMFGRLWRSKATT